MRDILPDEVIQIIRDRYLAGIADAEAGFEFSEGDEDSLTGALGQSISTFEPVAFYINNRVFVWKIYYIKIRGRGPNAPEKNLGADGIFQIEVLDNKGQMLRRKGLPFQAKKRWNRSDKKLLNQTSRMLQATGDGIVVDYASCGYTACRAKDVVRAEGRKMELRREKRILSLGQMLGNKFLECSIGVIGLYYEKDIGFERISNLPINHIIGTSVQELTNNE